MQDVRHIALVGAGGTGKTSILRHFMWRGFKVFPSISRDYYAMSKIIDESAYMELSPPEKASFQHGMRDYYQHRYLEFLKENSGIKTIADRSILDHFAFGVYGLEGMHTLDTMRYLVDDCVRFSNTAYTNLIFFPYPQPWMVGDNIADGFRNIDVAKNYCISSLMLATIFYNKVVSQRLTCELTILPSAMASPWETFSAIWEQLYGTAPTKLFNDTRDVGKESLGSPPPVPGV